MCFGFSWATGTKIQYIETVSDAMKLGKELNVECPSLSSLNDDECLCSISDEDMIKLLGKLATQSLRMCESITFDWM